MRGGRERGRKPEAGYIVTDRACPGQGWAVCFQAPSGQLHRVVSPVLPVRLSRAEAEEDLRRWLGEE